MRVLKVARAHMGAVVLGGAVLVGAAAGTTVIAMAPASSSTEGEVFQAPAAAVTEPVVTDAPEAPAPVVVENPAPVVVEAPVEAPPADNVEVVPAPKPAAPKPANAPEGHKLPDLAPGQDPEGVGTIGPDGRYYSQQTGVDGLPTYVPDSGAIAELLPGEPGYVPPTN